MNVREVVVVSCEILLDNADTMFRRASVNGTSMFRAIVNGTSRFCTSTVLCGTPSTCDRFESNQIYLRACCVVSNGITKMYDIQ